MKFEGFQLSGRNAHLSGLLQAAPAPGTAGQFARQGLSLLLSALMVMIPMGQQPLLAQEAAPQTAPTAAPAPAPLRADQLDQLVAPIALYPDALVAQVLAASTYPTQVVEADRWRQSMGNAPADQIASQADGHNWDPSVKALCAFPSVLAQMDRNLRWTTDLGNAYYNQPQDVMDSVQAMRHKAQVAGNLRSTPQQTVTDEGDTISIAPTSPTVVYVPYYDPWVVYGAPFPVYPGFYYAPPPGIFWGGLAIGFGIGIGIGFWGGYGWGWHHWGCGWHERSVFFNHNTYITRSTTVINHGFARPGGPPAGYGPRGAYARGAAGFHGASNVARPGGAYGHSPASYGRNGVGASRPSASGYSGGRSTYGNGSMGARASSGAVRGPASYSRSGSPTGGGRASAGGGHSMGGGGHVSGGGGAHAGHGR